MKILQHIRAFVSGMMGVPASITFNFNPQNVPVEVIRVTEDGRVLYRHEGGGMQEMPRAKPQPAKRKRTRKAK